MTCSKSISFDRPDIPTGETEPIMKLFVKALPALRELFKHDVKAAIDGDPSTCSLEEVIRLSRPSATSGLLTVVTGSAGPLFREQ